jgi:hypothetical protein
MVRLKRFFISIKIGYLCFRNYQMMNERDAPNTANEVKKLYKFLKDEKQRVRSDE